MTSGGRTLSSQRRAQTVRAAFAGVQRDDFAARLRTTCGDCRMRSAPPASSASVLRNSNAMRCSPVEVSARAGARGAARHVPLRRCA